MMPRTCTAISSNTPSTRRRPRSSNAASGRWPNCSTRRGSYGARTQGSSAAIMLGALSLKWKWRGRREAAGKDRRRRNLDLRRRRARGVGEFCRSSTSSRESSAPARQVHDRARGRRTPPRREHDRRGRRPRDHVHRPFRRHRRHQRPARRLKGERGLDVPLHVDAASGGFVWPFLYPHSEWDFRLEQVRSINASGHKFGLVYPGIGWLIFRERSDLPEDLVSMRLPGQDRRHLHAQFLDGLGDGARPVLQLRPLRHDRPPLHHGDDAGQHPRARAADQGHRGVQPVGDGEEQLPLVAFQLAEERSYDEFDIASQLAAERGWMVPAYTLPPNADHVKIMRALVKLTLGHTLTTTLANDLGEACATLAKKGSLHELRPPAGQDGDGLLSKPALRSPLEKWGRLTETPKEVRRCVVGWRGSANRC